MADIHEVPTTTSTKKKFTISNELIFILMVICMIVSVVALVLGLYGLSRTLTEPSLTAPKEKCNKRFDAIEVLTNGNNVIENLNVEAVGFYAVASKDTRLQLGSIVIFDEIITNHGNAYSGISGTFTAPVHGLYQFTLHYVTSPLLPATYLGILLNDIIQCRALANGNLPVTGTCSTLLELMPGDLINVQIIAEQSSPRGGAVKAGYSGLMGQLYEPL